MFEPFSSHLPVKVHTEDTCKVSPLGLHNDSVVQSSHLGLRAPKFFSNIPVLLILLLTYNYLVKVH